MVSMAVSTVSVIESIIVMRICCIQTRKMPAVVRFVAFRVIGRALCINRSPTSSCKPRRDSGEKIEFQANGDAKESLLGESTKPSVARNDSELVDKINDVLIELRKVRLALICFILAVFTARRKASFASAVYATANRPSVRLSLCHTPVLCQNEGTQRDAVFTIW